jgi:hypothetical protein
VSAFLLYCAFVSLVFTGVLLGRGVFFAGDISQHYVPWETYIDTQIEEGHFPLWADGFFGGHPIYAEGQSGILYPVTRAVYALFDGAQAFSIDMLLHLVLGGFFLYLLARRLNLGFYPSLYAGAVFALAGYPVSLIVNAPILRSVAWVPLIVMITWGIWQNSGLRGSLLLVLAFVMQIYAGSIQVVVMTIVLLLFMSIILIIGKIIKGAFSPTPIFWLLVVVLPLVILVSAQQILPTLELYNRSAIRLDTESSEATSYSFSPYHLLDLIIPPYWAQNSNVLSNNSIPFQMTLFLYIGFIPFLMALIGFLVSRSCGTWKIIALIGILMGLGGYTFFYPLILKLLPFLNSFRAPDRFLVFYSMSASLLAGYGFRLILGRELPMDPTIKRRWFIAIGVVLVVLLAGAFLIDTFLPQTSEKFYSNLQLSVDELIAMSGIFANIASIIRASFLSFLVVVFLTVILIFGAIVLRKHPERAILLGTLIFLLSFCEVGYYLKLNPGTRLINPEFYTKPPASVQAIRFNEGNSVPYEDSQPAGSPQNRNENEPKKEDNLFRIASLGAVPYSEKVFGNTPLLLWYHGGAPLDDFMSYREILNPNFGNVFGLNYMSGIASLYTASWDDFINMVDLQQDIFIKEPDYFRTRVHLWDLAGVKYIISDKQLPEGRLEYRHAGDVFVYENKRCLDRAFILYPEKVLPETKLVLDALTIGNLDPVKNLILQTGKESFYSRDPVVLNEFSSHVKVDEYSSSRVKLSGIALSDGYLVLTDAFYPGWICRVNDEPAKIYRAYGYFRAVPIKAGRFNAVFEFKPTSFKIGLFISATGIIIWIVLMAVSFMHPPVTRKDDDVVGMEDKDLELFQKP